MYSDVVVNMGADNTKAVSKSNIKSESSDKTSSFKELIDKKAESNGISSKPKDTSSKTEETLSNTNKNTLNDSKVKESGSLNKKVDDFKGIDLSLVASAFLNIIPIEETKNIDVSVDLIDSIQSQQVSEDLIPVLEQKGTHGVVEESDELVQNLNEFVLKPEDEQKFQVSEKPVENNELKTDDTTLKDLKSNTEENIVFENNKEVSSKEPVADKITTDVPKESIKEKINIDKDELEDDIDVAYNSTKEITQLNDKDVIKVKVGDKVNINSEKFVDELAEKIIIQADGKDSEFEIAVEPENLGKINIKITFENNHTVITLACSNNKTANLLSDNIKALSVAIESNTGNQATVNVKNEKESTYDQQNNSYDGRGQNSHREDSQNERKKKEAETDKFIHQMRLGLIEI